MLLAFPRYGVSPKDFHAFNVREARCIRTKWLDLDWMMMRSQQQIPVAII